MCVIELVAEKDQWDVSYCSKLMSLLLWFLLAKGKASKPGGEWLTELWWLEQVAAGTSEMKCCLCGFTWEANFCA